METTPEHHVAREALAEILHVVLETHVLFPSAAQYGAATN